MTMETSNCLSPYVFSCLSPCISSYKMVQYIYLYYIGVLCCMIKYINDDNFNIYEDYVRNHNRGHFLQSYHWARFKSERISYPLLSLDDNGNPRGAMLVLVHDEPILKNCLLYSPRGPIADCEVAVRELIDEAEKLAKKHNAYMLTVDPDITEEDALFKYLTEAGLKVGPAKDEMGILQPLAVFRIDIKDKSDEELLSMFHSKARYSVRASLKTGAVCRIGTRDELPAFQKLLVETAARDHFTARGLKYFNNMFDTLPEEDCKLFVVEYEGEIIAGSVLIVHGDKSWHLYGASSDAYRDKLPNFLMQWEMIRYSISRGCRYYDMRGVAGEKDKTKPLEGLFRFKKRFGGELVTFVGRLDIIYKPFTKKMLDTARGAKKVARKILGR